MLKEEKSKITSKHMPNLTSRDDDLRGNRERLAKEVRVFYEHSEKHNTYSILRLEHKLPSGVFSCSSFAGLKSFFPVQTCVKKILVPESLVCLGMASAILPSQKKVPAFSIILQRFLFVAKD